MPPKKPFDNYDFSEFEDLFERDRQPRQPEPVTEEVFAPEESFPGLDDFLRFDPAEEVSFTFEEKKPEPEPVPQAELRREEAVPEPVSEPEPEAPASRPAWDKEELFNKLFAPQVDEKPKKRRMARQEEPAPEAEEQPEERPGEQPAAAEAPAEPEAAEARSIRELFRRRETEAPETGEAAAEFMEEKEALAETADDSLGSRMLSWQQIPRTPKAGEMLVYDSELDSIDLEDENELPEARDYMPVRFSRHGRSGLGGGILYALFIISVSVILACVLWMFAADVLALNKPDTVAVVTITEYIPGPDDTYNEDGKPVDEDGNVITADVEQVASVLKDAEVIEFKWLFELFSQFSNAKTKIDPGTYEVSAKLDYRALVTEMQTGSGSQETTRITFPEGYTMDQIFTLLEDNGICSKEDLYEAAANYDYSYEWLDGLELGDARRLEGYLFPDTYDFYQGESAVNAINRFLSRFHYVLTMDMYIQAENLGISLHDAVIIASLIEEEAGAEDNRSYFASVIFNRLAVDMPLQLDCTLNYIKGTSTFNLSTADTQIEHPYNTYENIGLPPGPISNPGKASLEAALNPADTDYWYWYAYEGVTSFFEDYDDQQAFADAHPVTDSE